MNDLSFKTDVFTVEMDRAVEAHMEWTRRLLRCAMLHTPPGDDVLSPLAHTRCRFGNWFASKQDQLAAIDPVATQRIESVHQAMHDSIRALCERTLTGQALEAADLDCFDQTQAELLGLLSRFKNQILSSRMLNDPLTGLPLRYSIESDFTFYQNNARRNHGLLYVVMIDVDHFKRINDTYGHPVGDMVLRHLADTLNNSLRGNEPLYRFGGEEFLWLLPCHSAGEAEQSAHRLMEAVKKAPFRLPDRKVLKLTLTLGLAQVGDHEELASAIKRSDRAMYEGKKAGRDRYVLTRI